MAKLTKWLFIFSLSTLLLYSCERYLRVQGSVSEAERRLTELRDEADRLDRENEELRRRIGEADDAEKIAELARERLGLVMPTDKIFYADSAD